MELTQQERELIVNSLLFTSSADVCINSTYDFKAAAELAHKLQTKDIKYHTYLFKWTNGAYEDQEISSFLEKNVEGLPISDEL